MSDHSATHAAGHDDHGGDHHDHDWGKHLRLYWIIFGILMFGTCLTVAAAYMDFFDLGSRPANITLGLLIASCKASCVGAIFMHMKGEKHLVYKFLAFTAFFFLAMVFLFMFAQGDPLPADVTGNMKYIKQ
jgi:caa(3)-type oxidase subunit IV